MIKSAKGVGLTTLILFAITAPLVEGAFLPSRAKADLFAAPAIIQTAVSASEEAKAGPLPLQGDSPVLAAQTAANAVTGQGEPDGVALASAGSLADLVATYAPKQTLDPQARCLAKAIFFESRGQSLKGQLAVANVIIARTRSRRFPSTVCAVITQPHQFSFVRGGHLPDVPKRRASWRTSRAIAQIAMNESWKNPVKGALYFHTTHVRPGWKHTRLAQIDDHVFYR